MSVTGLSNTLLDWAASLPFPASTIVMMGRHSEDSTICGLTNEWLMKVDDDLRLHLASLPGFAPEYPRETLLSLEPREYLKLAIQHELAALRLSALRSQIAAGERPPPYNHSDLANRAVDDEGLICNSSSS